MKKIILVSLLSLLIVNKAFPAWAITGQTNVCATLGVTKSYEYKLTGFPAGSTEHNFYVGATGATVSTVFDDKFTVVWNSDCSAASTKIQTISVINWAETDANGYKVYKSYAGAVELAVNVARLGPLETNAWNLSPFACNTSPITYSIPAVCGASNYSWVIPPGWTPSGPLTGANVTSITVTPTATTGGTITVYAINSNNGCSLQRTFSATIVRPVQPPVFTTTTTKYCSTTASSASICVANVPNASSYSWTYPSGWTGPSVTTTNCATVNFNGQVKTGNICCQTNSNCGGTSTSICLPISYEVAPTNANVIWTLSTTSTQIPGKKQVTVNFGDYYWRIQHGVYVQSATQPIGASLNVIMANNDYLFLYGHNENSCGTTEEVWKGYQLRNGNLVLYDAGRMVATSTDENQKEDFKIFPNPASTSITVATGNTLESNCNLSIYNLLGEKVKQTIRMSSDKTEMNVSDLQNGIYFLQMENENAIIRKEKIVINH